jgi:hypothetical protein
MVDVVVYFQYPHNGMVFVGSLFRRETHIQRAWEYFVQ